MTRACVSCGEAFEAQADWMRKCWPCWRDQRDREREEAAYGHGFTAGLNDAERGYRDGYRDGLAAGRRHTDSGLLDPDLLTNVIALCHPDRHPGRVELANRVTSVLLALRDERRRVA